jgi:cell division septation protein DedD
MRHKYSFDQKTVRNLLLGLGGLSVLSFVAGLLVGVGVSTVHSSQSAEEAAAHEDSTEAAAEMGAPPPAGEALITAPERSDAREPEGNESGQPLDRDLAADLDDVVDWSNAGPGARQDEAYRTRRTPELDEEGAEAAGGRFAVQVGSFLVEDNARRLLDQLESRGYRSTIFRSADNLNRTWYSLRFGEYESQADALRAAADYRAEEKSHAVVRPVGAL